jgi:hypothetical protein
MTFYEFEEWQVCLKLNRSAKTSTAHDHVSISLFYRFSCGFFKKWQSSRFDKIADPGARLCPSFFARWSALDSRVERNRASG